MSSYWNLTFMIVMVANMNTFYEIDLFWNSSRDILSCNWDIKEIQILILFSFLQAIFAVFMMQTDYCIKTSAKWQVSDITVWPLAPHIDEYLCALSVLPNQNKIQPISLAWRLSFAEDLFGLGDFHFHRVL